MLRLLERWDVAALVDLDDLEHVAEEVAAIGGGEAFLVAFLVPRHLDRRGVEGQPRIQHPLIAGLDVLYLQAEMGVAAFVDRPVGVLRAGCG